MKAEITIPFFASLDDIENILKEKYGDNWELNELDVEERQVCIKMNRGGRN